MTPASLRRAVALLVTGTLALTAVPAASAVPHRSDPKTAAAITATLDEDVNIPGTAWMTRPDGKILVSYDSTVTGAKLKSLTGTTQKFGSQVVLEKVPGKLTKYLSGGSPIYGGEYKCSLGFNVQRKGRYYFLTAGHCGVDAKNWFQYSNLTGSLGYVLNPSYPWNDYALVVYKAGIKPGGSINLYNGQSQDIKTAMNPGLNQLVYRTGATSGLHSGRVTGLNATVNYEDGRVAGMIRTSVCAEPGDSGGPLFYRTHAFGLTSGGTGDCSSGGVTYFQPVYEALKAYGVSVY